MRLISKFKKKINESRYIRQLKNKHVDIIDHEKIFYLDRIKFGEYIYIGPGSYIMAKGDVEIGSNVIIGPKLTVWTENHNFKSDKMIPYDGENINKKVIIEDNVWIGFGVTLCPGSQIGEGSIIGMGTVVRGNIPPGSIVTGNPGKVVGKRELDKYYQLVKEEKFYYKIKKQR